jgi:murein DD-endopeptidase MepM/ murein hydrolase activator NlpD
MTGKHVFVFFGVSTLAAVLVSQAISRPMAEARTLPGHSQRPAISAAPETDMETLVRLSSVAPAVLAFGIERQTHLNTLKACPGLAPAHAEGVDRNLVVTRFKPQVLVAGSVRLASAPVSGGCISSEFGYRRGRLHKGVDYFSKVPVPVFAAGDGKVRKLEYRADYGNMIVIDHGHGVYTRYAHLESFGYIRKGDPVRAGDFIGRMGNTADIVLPRHLHYEVLTGRWGRTTGSFALTPVDVLTLPAADAESPIN